jgi:hypothetical protein
VLVEFGVQFFPNVVPTVKPAHAYWDEALRLCEHLDALGYSQVRTVEHYFEPYGGYTPNPHIFLVAAAQRTRKARLVTGAVLPAFNHPPQSRGRDRHGRCDLERPPGVRLRARLSAARIRPLRRIGR